MKKVGNLTITPDLDPIIVFDWETLELTKYLVDQHPMECQWWHSMEKHVVIDEEDGKGQIQYHLSNIFIPEQFYGSKDVESDASMLNAFWQDYAKRRGLELSELGEVIKKATVWCHSHHNMDPKPSTTDNDTWKEQKEFALNSKNKNLNPQAMIIFNKRQEYFSRVYDPEIGLEFENLPILTQSPTDFSQIDEAMKRLKLKPAVPNTTTGTQKSYQSFSHSGGSKTGTQGGANTSQKKTDSTEVEHEGWVWSKRVWG